MSQRLNQPISGKDDRILLGSQHERRLEELSKRSDIFRLAKRKQGYALLESPDYRTTVAVNV